MDEKWTPEATKAIGLCQEWHRRATGPAGCGAYLFGSAIYKSGIQFDSVASDLDIVCVLPTSADDAVKRLELLRELRAQKQRLELDMIPALSRDVCSEPGVSVVAITEFELRANIHKSGARSFFDKNAFLDLATGKTQFSFPMAGTGSVEENYRQAVEYVQGLRNRYLGVCANASGGLPIYRGKDPIPKSLLRVAAQLCPDAQEGEWYDTRIGLEYLHQILRRRRLDAAPIRTLLDEKISVRRGGRGPGDTPLDAEDQLLLAELLFDDCRLTPLGSFEIWDIDARGTVPAQDAQLDLLQKIRRIVPDALPLDSSPEGNQLRVRSSQYGFELIELLARHDALAQALKLERGDRIRVGRVQDPAAPAPSGAHDDPRIQGLIELIGQWRPAASVRDGLFHEINFFNTLGRMIDKSGLADDGYSIRRQVRNGSGSLEEFEFDAVLHWFKGTDTSAQLVPIELTRFRDPSQFANLLARLTAVSVTAIVVLYDVPDAAMDEIKAQERRFLQVNGRIRFVFIPLAKDPTQAE